MIGQYSLVRDDVQIGPDSKVWHHCNIYGCKIGKNTQIGSFCEVKEGVVIGDDCRFQSYVFVSEHTQIGNRVFIGPRVTFLNDKYPTASKAINKTWSLDRIVIEDEVSIGGGAVILPGVYIKKGAVIGAGSVVTKDVPKFAVICGNPARIIGNVKDKHYEAYLK